MKIKIANKKIVFAALTAIVFVVLTPIIQSCSSNNELLWQSTKE